ncbi:MAG: RNA repair domain-containing protein [Candidatus Woesearchaeota archaeon]|nr:RNA repair domain-containing protein [Candidatus Woesearchaeota archaeon]
MNGLNVNRLRESDKHFLWSLIGAIGIILFWRGLWNGIDSVEGVAGWSWLGTPALSLFIGLVILTFSGLIFQQFDPLGGLEKGVAKMLHSIQMHPKRKEFILTYYDNIMKKEMHCKAENIRRLEKNMLLIEEGGREIFIPLQRIRTVKRNNEIVWRL